MKNKYKLSKEDIISIIRLITLGIIGLGLTILFIFLYEKYNSLALTICTAIFSLVYMVLSLLIINKKDFVFQNTLKMAILFPLIYTLIVFGFLLFIEHKSIPDNPMRILDCFLWSIYTMPSFIVVMAILSLIKIVISYAG